MRRLCSSAATCGGGVRMKSKSREQQGRGIDRLRSYLVLITLTTLWAFADPPAAPQQPEGGVEGRAQGSTRAGDGKGTFDSLFTSTSQCLLAVSEPKGYIIGIPHPPQLHAGSSIAGAQWAAPAAAAAAWVRACWVWLLLLLPACPAACSCCQPACSTCPPTSPCLGGTRWWWTG